MSTKLAHQLTAHVKLLQKAVLLSDDKVLILKRHPDSATRPNCWDLPGGNSEWPTNITTFTRGLHLQDLCREIEEETGIAVDPESVFRRDLVYFDTTFEPEKEMFTILCGWRHKLSGEQTLPPVATSSEHTEYQWVDPADLDQYDFGFADFIPEMIRLAAQ